MIECKYHWRFACNHLRTRRQRIGHWLRNLATKIDGRISLAIELESTPAISTLEKVECVKFGLGKIEWALRETVIVQAQENVLAEIIKVRQ